MIKPHIHAVELRAFADGYQIQQYCIVKRVWRDDHNPYFYLDTKYRVKPHKWQTEMDAQRAGKEIQFRLITSDKTKEWIDGTSDLYITDDGCEYRVKPEVLRFRLYKLNIGSAVIVGACHTDDRAEELERSPKTFKGWIEDWREVEV